MPRGAQVELPGQVRLAPSRTGLVQEQADPGPERIEADPPSSSQVRRIEFRQDRLPHPAGDLRTGMASKTLSADDATKHAQRYGRSAAEEMRAVDKYPTGSPEAADALANAAEARAMMRELNAYAGGKPSAKAGRAATRQEAREAKTQAGGSQQKYEQLLRGRGIDPNLDLVK